MDCRRFIDGGVTAAGRRTTNAATDAGDSTDAASGIVIVIILRQVSAARSACNCKKAATTVRLEISRGLRRTIPCSGFFLPFDGCSRLPNLFASLNKSVVVSVVLF